MLILAISTSITKASKKVKLKAVKRPELQRVSYIYYLTQFDGFLNEALIDLHSIVNVIQPSFAKKLEFYNYKINVSVQKIDSSRLETFRMLIVLF